MTISFKHITVHCSATRPSQDWGAKEIDRIHRMENGWLRIGYHFVIRRDGTVENGRPLTMQGAHVGGYNKDNLGICLIGGIDTSGKPEDNFTPAQKNALRGLIERLLKDYPRAEIKGHRDWPGVRKACPSFEVKDWWASLND